MNVCMYIADIITSKLILHCMDFFMFFFVDKLKTEIEILLCLTLQCNFEIEVFLNTTKQY